MARDSLQSLRAALDAVAADLAALREQLTARVGLPDPAGGNGVLTATLGAVSWQQPAAPPAAVWGSIGGTLANQTDLQNALNARAQRGVANTWTAAQTFSDALRVGSGFTTRLQITAAGAVTLDATTAANMRSALGMTGRTTISTAGPSGGSDGDIWFRV